MLSDEEHPPLDAERIARIYDHVLTASVLYDADDTRLERDYPDILHDYVVDVPPLLAEVERLRTENAVMREIMRAVAAHEGVVTQSSAGWRICGLCEAPRDRGEGGFFAPISHAIGCPVAETHALLAQMERTDGEASE